MATEQPTTFGAHLRLCREAAGLSQEELAERAGLTASAIGALERGERLRPYPRTVQLLAKALGLNETRRAALIAAIPRRGANATVAATAAVTDASRRHIPSQAADGGLAAASLPNPSAARGSQRLCRPSERVEGFAGQAGRGVYRPGKRSHARRGGRHRQDPARP